MSNSLAFDPYKKSYQLPQHPLRNSILGFCVGLIILVVGTAIGFLLQGGHRVLTGQTANIRKVFQQQELPKNLESDTDKTTRFLDMIAKRINATVEIRDIAKNSQGYSLGSGSIIRSDGIILTCFHVAPNNTDKLLVRIPQHHELYQPQVLASDPYLDISILKINAKNLPTIPLAHKDSAFIGDHVSVLGSTLGLYNNIVQGIISQKYSTSAVSLDGVTGGSDKTSIYPALTITAPTNHGNSGGPALNDMGEQIGIVEGGGVDNGSKDLISAVGVSLLVPITLVYPFITTAMAGKNLHHATIGIEPFAVNNVYNAGGAHISRTGPAHEKDLSNDILVSRFNGQAVANNLVLQGFLNTIIPGEPVKIEYRDLTKEENNTSRVKLSPYKTVTLIAQKLQLHQ